MVKIIRKKIVRKQQIANCGANHKSNDWNYPIRQKIISSKTQRQLKNNKHTSSSSSQNVSPRSLPIPTIPTGFSYAQAVTLGNSNVTSSSMHSNTKNHDADTHNLNHHIGSSQHPTMEISNSSVNKPPRNNALVIFR